MSGVAAIFLGASYFPNHKRFGQSPSYLDSKADLKKYLVDTFEVAQEDVLDLFNDHRPASDQLGDVQDFVFRVRSAKTDLFVCYVGHGYTGSSGSNKYFLAVGSTKESREEISGLDFSQLAHILRTYASELRKFVFLDCCYAGSAAKTMGNGETAKQQELQSKRVSHELRSAEKLFNGNPKRGTALYCASSCDEPAIAPEQMRYTMFSDALLHVLRNGSEGYPEQLSLRQLSQIVWRYLQARHTGEDENLLPVRPEVHSPDQSDGDVSENVHLFPNAAFRSTKSPEPLPNESVDDSLTESAESSQESSSFAIVHMSDLHIDGETDEQAWSALVSHLNSVNPSLILITGDIVNSQSIGAIAKAKKKLEKLGFPYLLCKGNADNRKPPIPKNNNASEKKRRQENRTSSENFDRAFRTRMPSDGEVAYPDCFGAGPSSWKIAVIAVNTSSTIDNDRGNVTLEEIKKLRDASTKIADNTDLCIALQHHQLLPLVQLQKPWAGRNKPARVQKTSTGRNKRVKVRPIMENTGLLLEGLAEASVDIVLHGHEHRPFAARYSRLSQRQQDFMVVAAGSALGMQTNTASESREASMNVFELRDDGSVWLQEHLCASNSWSESAEPAIQLFSRNELRRNRLKRSKLISHSPTSKIAKHFELSMNRDLRVREIRTFWNFESDTFSYEVYNTTGTPKCVRFEVEWQDGKQDQFYPQYSSPPVDHKWKFKVEFSREDRRARRVTIETLWELGGLLALHDWELVKYFDSSGGLEQDRALGKEWVSGGYSSPLEELFIFLSLPAEVAPEVGQIQIQVEDAGPKGDQSVPVPATSPPTMLHVIELSPGRYVLDIPYPFPRMYYKLVWNLPDFARPETVGQFARLLRAHPASSEELITCFVDRLPEDMKNYATASLYIPNEMKWELIGCLHNQPKESRPFAEMGQNSIYRRCWWGSTAISRVGSTDWQHDLDRNEVLVIAVPIRVPGAPLIFEPSGMLRIGYKKIPPPLVKLENPASGLLAPERAGDKFEHASAWSYLSVATSEASVSLLSKFFELKKRYSVQ